MRDLDYSELQFVSGAHSSPSGPSSGCGCSPCPPSSGRRMKNNNGFGNGPESGDAPGNSGRNNSPNARQKQNNRGR